MFIKQYELWQSCNNNCVFCFNKEAAGKLHPDHQIATLKEVLVDLDRVVKGHAGNLSVELIGGEFFQGQLSYSKVRDLFFQVIHKLRKLGDDGSLQQVCLFVTLTIGDQLDLYNALEILTGNQDSKMAVWVSTSYDTRGRFTNEKLDNWKSHMKRLSVMPRVYRNTTFIFTQDFAEKIVSGELDLYAFSNEYKTTLFFKHPMPNLINQARPEPGLDVLSLYNKAKKECLEETPWFLPKRSTAMKAMSIIHGLGYLDRFMNLQYRADDLARQFNEETGWDKTIRNKEKGIESLDEEKNVCGHLVPYMCYSDSDKCIMCDKEILLDD